MNEIKIAKEKFDLLDNFPLGIFVLNENYTVLFWNSQVEIWTGILNSKILGKNLIDFFPNLNGPKYASRIQLLFEGGPPIIFSSLLHKYIIPSPLPDGQFRIQETAIISVSKEPMTGFYALFIIQDITDLTHRIQGYKTMRDQAYGEVKKRKYAEEQLKIYSTELETIVKERTSELHGALENLQNAQSQLIQSEKMAAIGQLAAGVAHEINNPAGFVSSNMNTLADYQNDYRNLLKEYKMLVALLEKKLVREEIPLEIAEQLDCIKKFEDEVDIDFVQEDSLNLVSENMEGMERIKKIVIDLKDFAHPGKDKLQVVDINKGLESTLNVVSNELKYKATVTKDFGELPQLKCYPQQLNQVFMNILVNAAHAIENTGKIHIKTHFTEGNVEIAISDTGCGIPEENLYKIFDPFFTTKDVGKGSGLGMNIAHNIMQRHSGTIDVESSVGVGTKFIIRIPPVETST